MKLDFVTSFKQLITWKPGTKDKTASIQCHKFQWKDLEAIWNINAENKKKKYIIHVFPIRVTSKDDLKKVEPMLT